MCLCLFNLYNMYMSAENHDLSPVIILGRVFSYDLPAQPRGKTHMEFKNGSPTDWCTIWETPLWSSHWVGKLRKVNQQPRVSTMEMHNYMQLWENNINIINDVNMLLSIIHTLLKFSPLFLPLFWNLECISTCTLQSWLTQLENMAALAWPTMTLWSDLSDCVTLVWGAITSSPPRFFDKNPTAAHGPVIVLDKKAPSHSHGYCVSSYDSGIVIPVKSYEIPQQNYHRILGSVFISVLISLLSRGAIILIYKLGARAFPHPHCLVMSVWWFLLKLFNVFSHFTRGLFWEDSHRKQFFVHTSQRTVATPGHGGPLLSLILMIFDDFRIFLEHHQSRSCLATAHEWRNPL